MKGRDGIGIDAILYQVSRMRLAWRMLARMGRARMYGSFS